jgi:hypothetical protein
MRRRFVWQIVPADRNKAAMANKRERMFTFVLHFFCNLILWTNASNLMLHGLVRIQTHVTPANCAFFSRNGTGGGAFLCAARHSPRHHLLFFGCGCGNSGSLLLAGRLASVVAADGTGVLLSPFVVQHARRHGGVGFGQGKLARRDSE